MGKNKKTVFINGSITSEFIGESIAHHAVKKNIGAHSIFLGQVRADAKEDRIVSAIHYEAYIEMAEEKLLEIREAAFVKYDLTCMHIYHSLGMVKTGEISLFVFTSSKHRKAAIEACNEIVERVKREVPVWGKEMFDDAEGVWKKNTYQENREGK